MTVSSPSRNSGQWPLQHPWCDNSESWGRKVHLPMHFPSKETQGQRWFCTCAMDIESISPSAITNLPPVDQICEPNNVIAFASPTIENFLRDGICPLFSLYHFLQTIYYTVFDIPQRAGKMVQGHCNPFSISTRALEALLSFYDLDLRLLSLWGQQS